jgi:hypothetical protein
MPPSVSPSLGESIQRKADAARSSQAAVHLRAQPLAQRLGRAPRCCRGRSLLGYTGGLISC